MRDELYINGRLVDLGKDTDIKLNYLVSKVYDLSNIMSNYSYTIELPKTANNTQIIDFSDTVNVVTEFPSREHSAEVRRDGAPLFTDGKAYIDSTGETIKVILKWGGSELLSQMQKVKMNEASDITDVLHWNQNLIRGNSLPYATWAGMLDGASSDTQVASRFRPVVKVLPFFDAAFAGNYTMDEKYKSFLERLWMLLPTTKGNKELVDKIHFELKGSFADTPTLITYATIGSALNYTGGYNLCDTFSGEGNNGIYLFPKSGKYNFKIKVWGNYTLAANIIIKIVQEDNAIKPELFKVLEEFTTDAKTLTPILEKEVTIEIEEGAKIEFLYFCDSFPNTFNGNADIHVRFLPSEKDYEETSYMMDYPIRENLPNMTVLDFVKSILGIFGLMAEIKDNIFHFFTMDDVILNKENALDITDFLVNKESEELRYTYGLTQNNILKYEEDELIPKGYGNYSFSANTYAKEENIVAQSKFAAGIPALYKLEDGKYRLQKSDKPRLFFENGKRTLRIGYYDEIFNNFLGEEVECTNFTFDELKYESLVSAFWNGYMSAFTGNARIRKVEVALPPAFMQTFSFQIPVIIDSNYYSVLSVKNYGRNGVAEMELVLLDGITPAKQTPLRNAILESFNTPIKFDYSSVALYSDMDRDTAINGKLIRELDETVEIPDKAYMPVDEGYGSAKKVDVNNIFLHKDRADTATKPITFEQGITVDTTTDTRDLVVRRLAEILQLNVTEVATLARAIIKEFVSSETFIPGFAGEGFKIWQIAAGEWHGEIDSLTIRRSLNAFELLIQKYRAINGGLVISQGSGKIKSVTETDTHYLLEMEGDLTLMPDDFIRCQTWGTGEVENYPFDFTDASKWRTNLFNASGIVFEYTNNLYRVNSISNAEESYFLLGYDLNAGESINISLKISGLEEGDKLLVTTGSYSNQIAQEITSGGTYTFNYLNDNDGNINAFVIVYQTTSVGEKNLVIEQVPEEKIETVTNKFYWVKVDGIENGKIKILKSEFDDGNQQPVAYPYDFNSNDWEYDEAQDITFSHTSNSMHLTRAGAEMLFLFSYDTPEGETVNITLKITGVNSESIIYTADDNHPEGMIIDKDGVYTFPYTRTPDLGVWGMFYKGTVGAKNILIEQIPEQPGFNSAWALDDLSFTFTHTLNSIHLTNAGTEQDAFAYRTLKPGESIRLNLQVTGLASGQEIRAIGGTPDAQHPVLITGDGTYKVEYRNTSDSDSVFAIGYKGAIGACDITVSIVEDASKLPAVGDEVVQMGNEKDLMRQALIYISAIGEPRIDALAGINSKSFAGKTKGRVGYLGDIVDPDFPADKQPQGYGGYFPNFYGKGTLVLSSGETVEGYTNNTILSVVPGEVKSEISKSVPGIRNYVLGSRMNRTDNAHLQGGTVNLVEDEKFGTVVEYSRPEGGGDFEFTWELSSRTELNNTDIVYTVIAKQISESGGWQFGGWDTTFSALHADSTKIDLGNGWYQYWVTLKADHIAGSADGGSFGINTIFGTWRFYAVAVYKGNRPTDWTPAPEDVVSESTSLIHQVADKVNISVEKKVKAGKIYIKGTGFDRNETRVLTINDDGNNYFTVGARGLALAVIDRSTLVVKEVSYYDVYGDPAAQNSLADKLNSLDDSGFVALASFDAIQIPDALRQALIRCGSSGYINQYRCPYAFLGIPGIGLGRGIEISVANTTAPPAEITTSIVNGMFTGSDNSAYEYTKGEVSVTAKNIRLQLNDTGIDIANRRITLKSAETHITTPDGRNIALFTTDANGNPIIQGRFLKLTDGAEIAGLTVSGKRLYNSDGQTSIQIGNQTTFPYRCTTISATSLTQVNVYSQDRDAVCIGATSTGADSYALVTRGQVQMAQGSNEHWNVPGVLSIYSKSRDGQDPYFVRVWGTGCPITHGEHQGNSMYKYSHLLGHTDYTVLGAVTSTRFTGYVKLVEKASSYFIVQNLGMSGKPDGAPFDMIILGRNV